MIFLILVCYQITMSQQFPVSCFKMVSPNPNETPLTFTQQLAKTFPLYQNAFFNYGLPFTKDGVYQLSDAQINQLLDSAAAHNVKIVLPDIVSKYAKVERFYFDATDYYFSVRQGSYSPIDDPDAEQPNPTFDYDHNALQATIANDYMVKDVKYQPVYQWRGGRYYVAWFRLKITNSSSFPSTTPVVDIEVFDVTNNTRNFIALTKSSFASDNTYYLFPINFYSGCSSQSGTQTMNISEQTEDQMPLDGTQTSSCYSYQFDLRVKWYGQVPVYLDNIRVDGRLDFDPVPIFSGAQDNNIKTDAKKFNTKSALQRYYLQDEPYFNQFRGFDYVNRKLKTAATENGVDYSQGKSLGHTAVTEAWNLPGTSDPYMRTMQEMNPYELSTDVYRLHYCDPLPGELNYLSMSQSQYQSAIDKFKSAQNNSIFSASKTWWYYPNITNWPGSCGSGTREPYLSEVFSQVHLALTYGAKGIFYFHYWTVPSGNIIGLIDPATLDPINSSSPYSLYHENKWDGIKSLNQKLAGPFGTILMGLTWQNGFSIHQQPSLSGTFVSSVTTIDAVSERYVELGFFKDVSSNDYLMVVNRRSSPSENRDISIVFNYPSATNLEVTDVNTGKIWIIKNNTTFTDATYSAGEGRLYKIEAHTGWIGTKIIPNEVQVLPGARLTILPGTTVNVGSGYTLTVNGSLIAKGTSTQRITFTSSSAIPYPGEWPGIICNGGGPDTLTYCDIKYAETGLSLTNTVANSYIANSMIENSSYLGMFVGSTGTSNTALKLYKTEIKNNDMKALQVNNAKVFLSYSKVENNQLQIVGSPNIYICNGGKLYVDSTRIQNNIGRGIDVSGVNSRASLSIDGLKRGYNTLTQNALGELYVHNSATAYLGNTVQIPYCYCDERFSINSTVPDCPTGCYIAYRSETRGGWNNVFNTYTFPGKLIDNSTSVIVYAQYTYWGTHQSGEFIGPVNYTNELTTPAFTPSKTTFTPPGSEIFAISLERERFIQWLLKLKKDIELNREGAIDALHNLAQFIGPGGEFQDALGVLWENFLTGIESSLLPNRLKAAASVLRLQSKIDSDKFDEAIELADNVLNRFGSNQDVWLYCNTRKIFASVGKGDNSSAWMIYNAIKEQANSIDSMSIKSLEDYLKLCAGENHGKSASGKYYQLSPQVETQSTPKEFLLSQNYPNPFNPLTIINYQLPIDNFVTIKVYSILGEEVATLVDGFETAGFKSVEFDGSNLSSGIYFVRMNASLSPTTGQAFSDVQKIILIK